MAGLQQQTFSCSCSPFPSYHHHHHRRRRRLLLLPLPRSHVAKSLPRLPPRVALAVSEKHQEGEQKRQTKLVTFLGKGGSGKTIAALLAAQHYANAGMQTCLVLQSQDPSADYLLGCKIGSTPTAFSDGALDVLRLESTKLLLDPLTQLKKADAKLNFSQGALDEVVGEELSVLPGMDGLLALGAMERLIGFAGERLRNNKAKVYDVVVYDGLSSEETLRLLGSAEKARWYLERVKDLAEKTDSGRITAPSILRLLETSVMQDSGSEASGRSIAEIWDGADRVLKRISETFTDPKRFSCYLVMNPCNELSIRAAMRYWGCASQAGVRVTGGFYADTTSRGMNEVKEVFSPLVLGNLPSFHPEPDINWSTLISAMAHETKLLLEKDDGGGIPSPVEFNLQEKKVTFLLPGFDKAEIKLSQWRGGSALLIEVGDQRRVVQLPTALRGKVAGAKFEDKSLIVTMKPK